MEGVALADLAQLAVLGTGGRSVVKLCAPCDADAAHADASVPVCNAARWQRPFFALKAIPRRAVSDPRRAAQVFAERDALRALAPHPRIVELLRTLKDDANLYFVLGFVAGGDLHRHLRGAPARGGAAAGTFAPARARFYAAEVCSALAHMHAAGFLHRDVKANNVRLDAAGHVKLVDLGFVRRLGAGGGGGTDAARAHTFCGTPHAMAPEVAALRPGGGGAAAGYGPAADRWSLGVLTFEMLTGLPPFWCTDRDVRTGSPEFNAAVFTQIEAADVDVLLAPIAVLDGGASGGTDDGGGTDGARAFVRALLERDPARRLAAAALAAHAWWGAGGLDAVLATSPPAFDVQHTDFDLAGMHDDGGVTDGEEDGGEALGEAEQALFDDFGL